MTNTYLKRTRDFIAGILLIASGIYIGYQMGERERIRVRAYVVVDGVASELMSNSAILQNMKLDRPSCARWLLENNVKAASANLETVRANIDVPPSAVNRLDRAVNLGKIALSSEDKSQVDVAKGCT